MTRILRPLRRHLGRSRRGQALVETAMALPIILILSLAAFDLGRAIVAHIGLTEATQEGSLFAAYEYGGFPTDSDAEIAVATRITTSSSTAAIAGATVETTCTDSPTPGAILVRSRFDLPVISPPARVLFGPTFALTVEVTATNFHEEACP